MAMSNRYAVTQMSQDTEHITNGQRVLISLISQARRQHSHRDVGRMANIEPAMKVLNNPTPSNTLRP
jgi:hypothetical protein